MKKIALFALGACMFVSTANAQKQAGGEKNLQVLFAPLGGSPISLNYGGLSFRKFSADGTSAWRLNFFFGLNSKTEVVGQPDTSHINGVTGSTKPELDKKTNSLTFSIRPGYEKHFAGTEKLSPYWGAEASFSMSTKKVETDELQDNSTSTTAATDWKVLTTTKKGDGANTVIGVSLIAGFDYYFAKNLSIGGEFGFGFTSTTMPDIEDESTRQNPTTGVWEVVSDPKKIQGSESTIGPNVITQFKLGWLF